MPMDPGAKRGAKAIGDESQATYLSAEKTVAMDLAIVQTLSKTFGSFHDALHVSKSISDNIGSIQKAVLDSDGMSEAMQRYVGARDLGGNSDSAWKGAVLDSTIEKLSKTEPAALSQIDWAASQIAQILEKIEEKAPGSAAQQSLKSYISDSCRLAVPGLEDLVAYRVESKAGIRMDSAAPSAPKASRGHGM